MRIDLEYKCAGTKCRGMKILTFILIGLGLVGLAAVIIRLLPVDAAAQHVDPATVTPADRPNFVLLRGEDVANLPANPEDTAARMLQAITAEGGQPLAGELSAGHASFVFRSRLMGYPDVMSVRLTDASTRERLPEGALTEIAIYSRALMGYSDLGVNRARVDRLLSALNP